MTSDVLKYEDDLPEKVGDRDSRDFVYITPISVYAKVKGTNGYESKNIPNSEYDALREEFGRQINLKLQEGDFRRLFPWGKGLDIKVFSRFGVDHAVPRVSQRDGRYFLTLEGTYAGKGHVLLEDLRNHAAGISRKDSEGKKYRKFTVKKEKVLEEAGVLSCDALEDLFEDDPDALGLITQAEQLSREDQTLIFRGEHSKARFFDNQRRSYSRRVSGQD